VRALAEGAALPPGARVLDIGCGTGRHLAALLGEGFRATGIDLSPVLLRDARAAGLPVARADMRRLPFPDAVFDLAASFFTSFGYFATMDEDVATLREFIRVTRPGGLLFLDLPNPDHVARNLVPVESLENAGRRVEITRAIEGDCVIKRIRIRSASGEERHEERVRLYPPASLQPLLAELGLDTVRIFGDERGGAFIPGTSPRASYLLSRPGVRA
jgi:SAM-dependent methyltransferase